MALFLSQRDTDSRELMDDPDCDLDELENTYRQFSTVNSLISQWYRIYKHEIRPHLNSNASATLLDVGFGGGDIPIKLARWASQDGLNLQVTAIDPDPRAINFVQGLERSHNIEFIQGNIFDLNPAKQQHDFVISNHLLHHLGEQELPEMLLHVKQMSTQSVIFNDIHRSDWAYLFFNILSRPIFRSSFITHDGLTSIRRSYTKAELVNKVPDDWIVETLFPFRLLLKYHHA